MSLSHNMVRLPHPCVEQVARLWKGGWGSKIGVPLFPIAYQYLNCSFQAWALHVDVSRANHSFRCLSVCMWHPPSLNHSKKFPEIWHEGRGPLTKKSDRARFWGKNRNWGFFALFFNIPPFCRVICFAGLKNSMGHVILRRKWLSKCFLIDWGQARCWGFTSVTSHSLSTLRRISMMIESALESEMIS